VGKGEQAKGEELTMYADHLERQPNEGERTTGGGAGNMRKGKIANRENGGWRDEERQLWAYSRKRLQRYYRNGGNELGRTRQGKRQGKNLRPDRRGPKRTA